MTSNVRELHRNLAVAVLSGSILSIFSEFAWSVSLFMAGFLYAMFFEYFYHRCIAHTELFPYASMKHREHHRVWHGKGAVSTDRSKPHLNEAWFLFPAALFTHYVIIRLVLGWMPEELVVAFVLFYCQFAILHWATHIEDNVIDNKILLPNGIFYWLRVRQITWHLAHHEVPKSKYNFTPPYPGDRMFGTGG